MIFLSEKVGSQKVQSEKWKKMNKKTKKKQQQQQQQQCKMRTYDICHKAARHEAEWKPNKRRKKDQSVKLGKYAEIRDKDQWKSG